MAKYKVAVIGCGGRSGPHIDAYQHIPEAKVVACHDIRQEAVDKCAAKYGLKGYSDAAQMLTAEKPDLVHIVTPPIARVELLTLVSDHGVPGCTVEKPLATGVRDWRELCALNARTRTKMAVCHQFRWHEDFVKCREAVASGQLGDVKFLDFSAGMNISGQGTHVLNYGMSLNCDEPVVQVFGTASGDSQMNDYHPAPDTTAGYLTFRNGVRGLWNNGYTAPRSGDPKTVWQHVRAAAYADKGRVLWEEFGTWEVVSPGGVMRGRFDDGQDWMSKNLKAQSQFYRAVFAWMEDSAKPAGTCLAQSLHEWQVVLALYASTVERRPVDIAGFAPPDDLFDRLRAKLRK